MLALLIIRLSHFGPVFMLPLTLVAGLHEKSLPPLASRVLDASRRENVERNLEQDVTSAA